jgi:hypothetical protein
VSRNPTGRGPKPQDPIKAFMRKILVDLETGCWEWQGALDAAGYGRAHDHEAYQNGVRQTMAAHRLAWRLFKGPIPAGMLACHRCDNPRCANPEHVFLGTYQDNNRDISEKGRHRNGQKTHCKHGHAFTPENTECRPTVVAIAVPATPRAAAPAARHARPQDRRLVRPRRSAGLVGIHGYPRTSWWCSVPIAGQPRSAVCVTTSPP